MCEFLKSTPVQLRCCAGTTLCSTRPKHGPGGDGRGAGGSKVCRAARWNAGARMKSYFSFFPFPGKSRKEVIMAPIVLWRGVLPCTRRHCWGVRRDVACDGICGMASRYREGCTVQRQWMAFFQRFYLICVVTLQRRQSAGVLVRSRCARKQPALDGGGAVQQRR